MLIPNYAQFILGSSSIPENNIEDWRVTAINKFDYLIDSFHLKYDPLHHTSSNPLLYLDVNRTWFHLPVGIEEPRPSPVNSKALQLPGTTLERVVLNLSSKPFLQTRFYVTAAAAFLPSVRCITRPTDARTLQTYKMSWFVDRRVKLLVWIDLVGNVRQCRKYLSFCRTTVTVIILYTRNYCSTWFEVSLFVLKAFLYLPVALVILLYITNLLENLKPHNK